MAIEYYKPMLDVGSPRVFNCNVMSRRIHAKDPAVPAFFRNKQLNNLVLIKDTLPPDMRSQRSAIGTKLYFPLNENDIYAGGRTIFVSDKHLEAALAEQFGENGLSKEALAEDLKIMRILDRLPSLDPFLLKDVFLNEKITVPEQYFEVEPELWKEIQNFIIVRFEALISAAFPDAMKSDEKVHQLIEKIWEARDLDALKPLTMALRLPPGEELEIFSAWKGVSFYSFQADKMKAGFIELFTWLKDLKLPTAAVTAQERNEVKEALEISREQLRLEWHKADTILRQYQDSYDKMFKFKTSSAEFVAFMKNSRKLYWDLGNSLGKVGHATYCWDALTKRHKERKLPWEPLREVVQLLAKILKPEQKANTAVAWQ